MGGNTSRFEYVALRRGFGHGGKPALNTGTSTDGGSIPQLSANGRWICKAQSPFRKRCASRCGVRIVRLPLWRLNPRRRGACLLNSARESVPFDSVCLR